MLPLSVTSLDTKPELEPKSDTEDTSAQTLDARFDSAGAAKHVVRLGQRAGRFVLLSEVGRGGMGTVFAAYDEHLERKVAIKLLHPSRGAPADASYHQRLLREAQAMARVAHPNVVSVYEAGETGGQVFLAMEFVDGVPLSQWQKQSERTWEAVLEMYLQAGRGLAAAHAQGLVHGDFKPDNVLVGLDGRARVLDFGLARFGELQSEAPRAAAPQSPGETVSPRLTVGDNFAGTPGYMSPEQYQCKPLDARSDQFSFCVALYEVLYGSLPFGGKSVAELAASTAAGMILPAPASTHVPEEVYRILTRGLKTNPEDRFPTLEALLNALHLETTDAWGGAAISRRSLVNAVVVVGMLLTVLGQLLRAQRPVRIREMLIISVVLLTVVLGGGLMRRRTLLRNALHRRVWLLIVITLLQNFGLRLIATYQGESYSQLRPYEMLVLAGSLTMLSLYLGRGVLWLSGLLVASTVTSTYFGDAASRYVSWTYSITIFGVLWFWNQVSTARQETATSRPLSQTRLSGAIDLLKRTRSTG